MTSKEIIDQVLSGKDFNTMTNIYMEFGFDVVEKAIKDCKDKGIEVPHVIMDVRGSIAGQKYILSKILKGSTFETQLAIYKNYGFETVEHAIRTCKQAKIKIPHVIMDLRGTLYGEQCKEIINTLATVGSFDDKLLLVDVYGKAKVEEAIKYSGGIRKVPHVIADVIGTINSQEKSL